MRKTNAAWVLALTALGILACTKSHAGNSPAAGGTGGNPNVGAQDSDRATTADASARESSAAPGTGFRFATATHEPHYPVQVPPAPPLHSLPRFVDGSNECFAEPRYRYGYGYGSGHARPAPAPQAATRPSHGRLGGSHKSRAPKVRMGEPRIGGRLGTSGTGSGGGGRAPGAYGMTGDLSEESAQSSSTPPRVERRTRAANEHEDAEQRLGAVKRSDSSDRQGFGDAIYLSNDDTMSLSSAQRVIWAIDHFAPIPRSHVRPHELLNYFSFETQPVAHDHDFSVVAHIAPSHEDPNTFQLGLAVQGRPHTKASRRNVNLSYVVDRSGSMSSEGRMSYLKQGLLRSLQELKAGDIVNITLFESSTCQLASNFVVGRDDMSRLHRLIERIQPRGSTNLHAGLSDGYQAADQSYRAEYENRVIMVTDALANTGVTNEQLISTVGEAYDQRRIRLSGIGVGRNFNDSLLDRLTERGKGAYVFLGSEEEVDAVFGRRFVSLITTIANDAHFKLHLPPSLRMKTFYGEEASTIKERVQAIHYFAGTSQMFLSDLESAQGDMPGRDQVMLSVEYQDPETGRQRVERFAWRIGDIAGHAANLDKATLVSTFARRLGQLSERPLPRPYQTVRHGWDDAEAYRSCESVRVELAALASSIQGDPEVTRVQSLWNQFCARYQAPPQPEPPVRPHPPRNNEYFPDRDPGSQPGPVPRNNDYAPDDSWPSARR